MRRYLIVYFLYTTLSFTGICYRTRKVKQIADAEAKTMACMYKVADSIRKSQARKSSRVLMKLHREWEASPAGHRFNNILMEKEYLDDNNQENFYNSDDSEYDSSQYNSDQDSLDSSDGGPEES